MIPLDAIVYTFYSAILVVSFFFAIRLLFAHDVRREAWRGGIKRRIYMTQAGFKRASIVSGWICLLISLATMYHLILDLFGV